MALLERLGRVAKLGGILGLALGSLALTVCGGRTGPGGEDAGAQDAAPVDASVDAAVDPDGSPDPLDAQLWDVICE